MPRSKDVKNDGKNRDENGETDAKSRVDLAEHYKLKDRMEELKKFNKDAKCECSKYLKKYIKKYNLKQYINRDGFVELDDMEDEYQRHKKDWVWIKKLQRIVENIKLYSREYKVVVENITLKQRIQCNKWVLERTCFFESLFRK